MVVKIIFWNEEKEDMDRHRYNQVNTVKFDPRLRKLQLTFLSHRPPLCLNIDKTVRRIITDKQLLYRAW